ncbi:MAG: right-handed parallel beta-helix repeat-containing protein [Phycisphaerae bacterium]
MGIAAAGAQSATVYVNAAATGANDGSSWVDAFTDLGAALRAAQPGDQLWVVAGTYRPSAVGDREAAFELRPEVEVYGGFAGGESRFDERDSLANVTILSGDLAGDDGDAFGNTEENSYQVVRVHDAGDTALIDGFTIRAGRADGPALGDTPQTRDCGAAVFVWNSSARILNCEIADNWSQRAGAIADLGIETRILACRFARNYANAAGAGLHVGGSAAPILASVEFLENVSAGEGGAIAVASPGPTLLTGIDFVANDALLGGGLHVAPGGVVFVTACNFHESTGALGGGGIFADHATLTMQTARFSGDHAALEPDGGSTGYAGNGGGGLRLVGGVCTLENGWFVNNRAALGAGIFASEGARLELFNTRFERNDADAGAGIYAAECDVAIRASSFSLNLATGLFFPVGGAAALTESHATLVDCTFTANAARLGGGALYVEGDAPVAIRDCAFHGNSSDDPDTPGWGGGLLVGFFASPLVVNSTFVANRAHRGAGAFVLAFASPSFANSSWASNTADAGGAIFGGSFASASLANCAVWGNGPVPIDAPETLNVRFCLVEGGFTGQGNRDADPRFKRPATPGDDGVWGTFDDDFGDQRLNTSSPGIDAGDTRLVPSGTPRDRGGRPRLQDVVATADTGHGPPPIVDIGAYEADGTTLVPADLNCDGVVNSFDIDAFVLAIADPAQYSGAYPDCNPLAGDVNTDGYVNHFDVDGFARCLAGACP